MKNIMYIAIFTLSGFSAFAQQKIGNNPTVINANAVLELESTNRGFLLPRVALTATNNVAPLTAHVAGMAVYNTASTGTGLTAVTPGYYYNDGTQWVKLANVAGNDNIILPQSSLTNTTTPAGLAVGHLIYNTNPASGLPVGPSFWNGSAWVSLSNYGVSASVVLNGNTLERAALTGDVTATQNSNTLTIANGAVNTAKLADNAVTSAKIVDGTIVTADLADNAVTSAKIVDGTIATVDVANGAITNVKMSAGAGTEGRIPVADAAGNVTYVDPATASSNIYNTNGTLTGNRTVTQGANSLTFTGTGNTIFNSGNVGIGTSSPGSNLHVNSTTGEAVIRLSATGTALISQFSGGADNTARTSIGSGSNPNRIVLNNVSGLVGIGTIDPETPLDVAGTIRARAASTGGFVQLESGTTANTGYIAFHRPDGIRDGFIGWLPNRMNYQAENGSNHIFGGGNVGIGTSSPTNTLHVRQTTFNPGANDLAAIKVSGSFGGGMVFEEGTNRSAIWALGGHSLYFGSGGTASGIPTRMVIRDNGTVGIGTAFPETPLHVTGLTRVRNESTSGFVDLQTGTSTNTGYIQFNKPDNTSTGYIGLDMNNMFYQATNGSNHIFGGGNVGIGTASPTNTLQVHQTTFNPASNDLAAIKVSGSFGGGMVFNEGANRSAMWALGGHSLYFGSGGTSTGIPTRMVIRDNGNIGIGTSTPTSNLHIQGTTDPVNINVEAVGNAASSLVLDRANGTVSAKTVANSGDNLGFVIARGWNGSEYKEGPSLIMKATENWNATSSGASLSFATVPNGTNTSIQRLYISDAGNVGIGTLAPTNRLDVRQTAFNPGSNDLAAIKVSGSFGGGMVFDEGTSRSAIWALGGHSLYFGSGGTASGIPTRMVIRDNGTVGIGTAFPETPLHVTGLTRVRNESTSGFVDLQTGTSTNTGYIQFNKPDNTSTGFIGLDLNNMFYQATNGSNHIFGGGNVGIGVSSPSHILHINGQGRATNSAWATTSDKRLKENIVEYKMGIADLMKIKTYEYNYKAGVENMDKSEQSRTRVGIMAQEIETILPRTVTTIEENGLSDQRLFNADELTFLLINATQDQQKIIEAQQKTIEELSRQMQILMELIKKD